MKAKIGTVRDAEKFENLNNGDWFFESNVIHMKSADLADGNAIYFDDDGDVYTDTIDDDTEVTPIQVTISVS